MKSLLLAVVAGLVSALAFEPVGAWSMMVLALAVLMWLVERAPSMRSALARGWWFGFGQFGLGLNWIATAFTYQAAMPAWLGWVAVLLLSLYLAIFPAAAAGLAWRWGRTAVHSAGALPFVLLFAAAWVVTEYLRSVLFTGFPWNAAGVALLPSGLAWASRWVGTYGLSALAVLLAGTFLLAVREETKRFAILMGFVLALAGAAWAFSARPPVGAGPPVRVVQPNVSQAQKHEVGYAPQLRRFRESAASVTGGRRLLLWPEDGVPFLLDEDPLAAEAIGDWLRPGDLLLTGGFKVERDRDGRAVGARNSAWVVDSDGRLLGRYDKAHLVPYGEYLPMRALLEPLGLSRLVPGTLDTLEGPGPRTLELPGFGQVGVQICYEIIFSGNVVDAERRPDFIFNPSNDAWFGAWGPPQHLAHARMRALEEGLPVLRATPTGISAVIDAQGRLLHSIPLGEMGVIDAALPLPAPPTLFARFGNLLPFAFALLLVAAAIAVRRKAR